MRPLVLWVVLAVSACGCGFEPLERLRGLFCAGSRPRICLSTVPTGTIVVSENAEIDTTDNSVDPRFACAPSTDPIGYCVIAAESITIAATTKLRAFGSRPLVLLASGRIELKGAIDVSSMSALAIGGAGADPPTCQEAQAATVTAGGAGGSFGGKGGDGQIKTVQGGIGGQAAEPLRELPDLRGGCPGGNGADVDAGGTADEPGGPGGRGGGAVALVAAQIRIEGTINASGAGGGGGLYNAANGDSGMGGGGGGSGGMISLDAPSLVVTPDAQLFANGGGGGGGGGNDAGGLAGGESTGPTMPGAGGKSSDITQQENVPGGDGSHGKMLDGARPDEPLLDKGPGGGGGGGGGAGFIYAPGIIANPRIAPPPRGT